MEQCNGHGTNAAYAWNERNFLSVYSEKRNEFFFFFHYWEFVLRVELVVFWPAGVLQTILR